MTADGAREIARRARGTPRVAGRLLRRVRDLSEHAGHTVVDVAAADAALKRLGVDDIGLDKQDMRYLHALCEMFGGGPTGADTLAAALSEARDALGDRVAIILDGGPVSGGVPSSVVRITDRSLEVLREGALDRDTLQQASGL